ncbi:hypothetical protein LINPERPRIM_LOCUS40780 [Linum perenne]
MDSKGRGICAAIRTGRGVGGCSRDRASARADTFESKRRDYVCLY